MTVLAAISEQNPPTAAEYLFVQTVDQDISSKFKSVISATDKGVFLATAHQRELFTGLIRIHALVHAYHDPMFGQAMMEELKHHGYRIGPGTIYPLLHGMERGGLLKSEFRNVNGRRRRVYRITAPGKRALDKAREKVDELHHELHEEQPRKVSGLIIAR